MNTTKKKNVVRLTESDLRRIIKESVKNVLNEGEEFNLENFGENSVEQVMNMKFTKAEQKILNFAWKLNDSDFTDNDYFELAFYFAKHNGLNG